MRVMIGFGSMWHAFQQEPQKEAPVRHVFRASCYTFWGLAAFAEKAAFCDFQRGACTAYGYAPISDNLG